MKKRTALMVAVAALVLLAALVVGLGAPVASQAATSLRPQVTALSPNSWSTAGGTTVVISGRYFRLGGRNVVKAVTFGLKTAKHVDVISSTKIKVVAPAGKGTVNVRVTTSKGVSSRVAADRFIYVGPATKIAVNAGDAQTASLGTAVAVAPSVIVKDAKDRPVPGVKVTFAVAGGDGSVTGAVTRSNGAGVATVGSWKLGIVAGADSLTATSAGLAGSPVTFTATGSAGILTVKLAGTTVRAYSLAELQALTPFTGWAGLGKSTAVGPDAITGVKVTDIVQNALGTPLAATQSVNVAEVDATPYNKVMSYDLLTNLTGITFWTAADTTVQVTSYTGPMAAILMYSDPSGNVMPVASGPLRFVVADATNESLVFKPTNLSVSNVNVLDVVATP